MDRSSFTSEMTGTLVPVYYGPPELQVAFVPFPLPPKWKWPEGLWRLLLEARTLLASLDGTGKHLPNPEILLQPLQGREAQLSSQLEGTITDPQQQVLFEADPSLVIAPGSGQDAYREVHNYRKALRIRLDRKNKSPLSLDLTRELHEILMTGVRGADQTPGEFRTTQNQIGRPPRHLSCSVKWQGP